MKGRCSIDAKDRLSAKHEFGNSPGKWETSHEDFMTFRRECEYWLKEFGVRDYAVLYSHKQQDSEKTVGAYASCSFCTIDRTATINLAPVWEDLEPNDYWVRWCSFHEVCELWLGDLRDYIEHAHLLHFDSMVDQLIHRYIRTLETVFFDAYYEREHLDKEVDSFEIEPDPTTGGWKQVKDPKNFKIAFDLGENNGKNED
jgi:hypothetical protein